MFQINVEVFNLMLGLNETKLLVQHKSCENKWNCDKYWGECKELDDWSSCKDNYM